MARFSLVVVVTLSLAISMFPDTTTAQLKTNFYGNSCPNVEQIVKKVVQEKNQTDLRHHPSYSPPLLPRLLRQWM